MIENIQRHKVKVAKEEGLKARQRLKSKLIECKREQYQFFKGQSFDVFDPTKLASHGWKHRSCKDDYFTLLPHARVGLLQYVFTCTG